MKEQRDTSEFFGFSKLICDSQRGEGCLCRILEHITNVGIKDGLVPTHILISKSHFGNVLNRKKKPPIADSVMPIFNPNIGTKLRGHLALAGNFLKLVYKLSQFSSPGCHFYIQGGNKLFPKYLFQFYNLEREKENLFSSLFPKDILSSSSA